MKVGEGIGLRVYRCGGIGGIWEIREGVFLWVRILSGEGVLFLC